MTTIRKVLIPTQVAPIAVAEQYEAPANTRAVVDALTATNTTAGALTITAHLVPSGAAPVAANIVTSAVSIAPGASYLFPEVRGHDLEPGGALALVASGVGINIRASGREMTNG